MEKNVETDQILAASSVVIKLQYINRFFKSAGNSVAKTIKAMAQVINGIPNTILGITEYIDKLNIRYSTNPKQLVKDIQNA